MALRSMHPGQAKSYSLSAVLTSGQILSSRRSNPWSNRSIVTLFNRNISLPSDLDPTLRFAAHQIPELLRTHGFGFGALGFQEPDEFWRCQHLANLGVELINDLRRQTGRTHN